MRTVIVCTIFDFSWGEFWDFFLKNPTVVSGLLGILVGSVIGFFTTAHFNKRKQQDDISFKVVDQYFEKFNESAFVKKILEKLSEDETSNEETKSRKGKKKNEDNNDKNIISEVEWTTEEKVSINRILKLGSWYNFVNGLKKEKILNKQIIDEMPLQSDITDFVTYFEDAIENNEKFKASYEKTKNDWKNLEWQNKKLVGAINDNKGEIEQKN